MNKKCNQCKISNPQKTKPVEYFDSIPLVIGFIMGVVVMSALFIII